VITIDAAPEFGLIAANKTFVPPSVVAQEVKSAALETVPPPVFVQGVASVPPVTEIFCAVVAEVVATTITPFA
jgi:hypothetical protein